MIRVNTNYCRPSADGLSIEYAPVIFPPSPNEPMDIDYLTHGWYRNNTGNPPSPPEGKTVVSTRYEIEDNVRVISVYTYGDMPKRVRVFSKMKLEEALFSRGLLDSVDAFIDAQTITNKLGQTMPLRRKYETANDFRNDNIYFSQFLSAAKTALNIDDETADTILAEAEATA